MKSDTRPAWFGSEPRRAAAALVAAIRKGEREAEARLVELYGPGLLYVLRRETRNYDVADDLYQETFRIVLLRLRRRGLGEPEKLAGFLLGVARRLISVQRRATDRFLSAPDLLNAIPDDGPDPLDQSLLASELDRLRAAIEHLSVRRDRELLIRRYLMDQDKQTICAALHLEGRKFDKILYRARLRLKKLFAAIGA